MRYSILAALLPILTLAQPKPDPNPGPGDAAVHAYFRAETEKLQKACLANIKTAADWDSKKSEYRRQLAEMLGLDPAPEKTDLKPVITGKIVHPDFTVENLHFQSRPGLYVTANLYLPKNLAKPAPAILYVCGHGNVKKDGISYGAKVYYQHWGGYLAKAGYVCLIIDTIELGEFECTHHGTNNKGMWWWNDRGYTPAGPEAWNAIRSLDYLETRPEVDKTKLGVTGRSGGGAYSWWLAALDERVKCAVPTAGIADLQSYVVDGAIEGHCDCMFMLNTYRWDFPQVAAMVAPRPLLLQNTDKDWIFPLDGVYRIHQLVRNIYQLTDNAKDNFSISIGEGPHKDTQNLQVPTLRWFNRHFKADESQIEHITSKPFEPQQLKVFKELPKDSRNANIHEWFVPQAPAPKIPADKIEWEKMRDSWMTALKEKSFRGWPATAPALDSKPAFSITRDGLTFSAYDFTSQENVPLRLWVLQQEKLANPDLIVLNLLDETSWPKWLAEMSAGFANDLKPLAPPAPDQATFDSTRKMLQSNKWIMAYLAPRGVGPTANTTDKTKRTHILRRYALLGQTLESMQVWDTRRAIQTLRALPQFKATPLWLQADGPTAGVALYASLFEPDITRLDLHDLPTSHATGPHFLNVLKTLDLPAAVAMAAERSRVVLYQEKPQGWDYLQAVTKALNWPEKQFQIRTTPAH